MSTKRSITTQKVLDECTEEWRPLEEVIAAAVPTVPPGKALRKYEARSGAHRKGVKPELPEDEKIYSGARHYAVTSIRTLTHSNLVETQTGVDGITMIRLMKARPAIVPPDTCPHCLRPYDQPGEAVVPPFAKRGTVIFPQQFNRRRFG